MEIRIIMQSPRFGVDRPRSSRIRRSLPQMRSEKESIPLSVPGEPHARSSEDRLELSRNLSIKYLELRQQVTEGRRRLKSLREDFGRKEIQLAGLLTRKKSIESKQAKLNELRSATESLSDTLVRVENPALKLECIKKELKGVVTWNKHIEALVVFLEAQQGPILKQSVTTVQPRRSRSSPRRHWSP